MNSVLYFVRRLPTAFLIILFQFIYPASSAAQVISTVAGGGPSLGDGGPAINCSFNYPEAIAVDTFNNIYVADRYNARVRRIDGVTGIITTIAGIGGSGGSSGNGGPAVNAGVSSPVGLMLDSVNNLYITDFTYAQVRKITAATGIITGVAGTLGSSAYGNIGDGGPALSALLNQPYGSGIDRAGNIYVADGANARVRRVDRISGIINAFAGTSQGFSGDGGGPLNAQLFYPSAVDFDAAGNMYIADLSNNRIRKLTATTNTMSTIAGNGNYSTPNDMGGPGINAGIYPRHVKVDRLGKLLITDMLNNRVCRLDLLTNIITLVAGSGNGGDSALAINAYMASPMCAVDDKYGDIFIAEAGTSRIRKVTFPDITIRNGEWNDPTIWKKGKVPDAFTQITIAHDITLNSDRFVHSISIQTGHTLTIGAGYHLNVVGH